MVRPAVVALLALVLASLAAPAFTAAPLFPTPLHITRQVYDPISETTTVLDEYGVGNRLISVRGARTSIADYEKGELIEIDREAATYSITRFDAVAKATSLGAIHEVRQKSNVAAPVRSTGIKATRMGRNAEFFEADVATEEYKQRIEIAVDREAVVSKEALEVLLGVAYPGTRRAEHEAVFSAARSQRTRGMSTQSDASDAVFALPVEQIVRYDVDGRQLEFRTSVVRVGNEPPPSELVSIPPGARLVVSRYVAVTQELELLERGAPVPPRN